MAVSVDETSHLWDVLKIPPIEEDECAARFMYKTSYTSQINNASVIVTLDCRARRSKQVLKGLCNYADAWIEL